MTKIYTALRRLLYLFLFLACTLRVAAQQTRQYAFQHFTTAQGLASNFINNITQDQDGFMWLATQNGLQRYDGNRFQTVRPVPHAASDGLIDMVAGVWSDAQGRVWLLTNNNRVALFDTRRFEYREARVLPGYHSFSYITKYLFEGAGGQLFLKDAFGPLYRYDAASHSFRSSNELPQKLAGNRGAAQVQWDAELHCYWLCGDTGVVRYDPVARRASLRKQVSSDERIRSFTTDEHVYQLYVSPAYLYYWSWPPTTSIPTLVRIDKHTGAREAWNLTNELGMGYHEPTGFLEQRSGRTWIFGNAYLAEWTGRSKPFIPVPRETANEGSIRFDQLYAAYEDRERNVWLATDDGIYLFNPDGQLFNSYNLLRPGGKPIEAPVQTVCQLPDSSFFIGTWSKGLFYYDKDFNPLQLPASLAAVKFTSFWDIAVNKGTGQVWMGLQPGRIVVYDPRTKLARVYNPPILRERTVRQVVSDLVGNIWIGLQDGRVLKWDIEKAGGDPSKGYEEILQVGRISKLHRDRQGNMWIGSWENGLYQLNASTGKLLRSWTASGPEGYRLFNNQVTDMSHLDDSTVLITAGCINILNTRTGQIRFFSSADGLPADNAISIQKDYSGILWVGLANGLCRINLDKRTAVFYDRRDGMIYDNFAKTGVELLSNGKLLFFTDHNILQFDPRRFQQTTAPRAPQLTGITLQGVPLNMDSLGGARILELRYDHNALSFEFSGLTFTPQKKLHYFYKLDGLDKSWMHIENDFRVAYNYLPPGHYLFQVRSENADGLTSDATLSIPITVRPPLWQTWWFYALMILLGAFGLYLIDQERLRRLSSLQQVRTQIAGNLHQEVETTLSDIHVLSEIAKIRAGANIEQSKDFIDQISHKSRGMMEAMDDVLWSIDPANDSMHRTLMRIREFTDGIKSNHTMDIDLIVDRKVERVELRMALRHELFFFYKESLQFLLANVICDQVFINLKLKGQVLLLEIITSCEEEVPEFRNRYREAIGGRVQAMKGSLEITSDHNNLSIVLRVAL
jgi:ligand-binding sensor domain-containing protein